MAIKNIFHYTYYFDQYVKPEFPGFWVVVVIMALILVLTIILHLRFGRLFKKLPREKKFWWSHWLNIGYTVSVVELVWLFFRYQSIAYFNWRLWPALIILGVTGWIGYLVYYRYRLLPQERAEQETQKSRAYYFRRRKR